METFKDYKRQLDDLGEGLRQIFRETTVTDFSDCQILRLQGKVHMSKAMCFLASQFLLLFQAKWEMYRSGYSRNHPDDSVVALDRALTGVPCRLALEAGRTSRTVSGGDGCGNASPDRHVTSLMLHVLMLRYCFESSF